MKVLFYIEPLIEKNSPYWKEGWVNQLSVDLINTLKATSHTYDCRIMLNEPLAQTMQSAQAIPVYILSQEELLAPFSTYYLDASISWNLGTYTNEQLSYYVTLMKHKLQEFTPDIIITFTPVPFFKSLYSSALILHHEFSFFSRSPFPYTWFLDPTGVLYSHVTEYFEQIQLRGISSEAEQNLTSFKSLCLDTLKTKSPFNDFFSTLKEKFEYLLFLPLQDSDYYSFDSFVPFKSQYEYCVFVLDQTPLEMGVVVNTHPEYPILSKSAVQFLRSKYPNFIYHDDFNTIYASGQFILPYIDAVVTVSSTIGLLALLLDKKMICLGGCFKPLADGHDLLNVKEIIEAPILNRDAIIHYLITHYSIPSKYLYDPKWLHSFLMKSIERFQYATIGYDFLDPIDNDTDLYSYLSEQISQNSTNIPIYRTSKQCHFYGISPHRSSVALAQTALVQDISEFQEFYFKLDWLSNITNYQIELLNEPCVIELDKILLIDGAKQLDCKDSITTNALITYHPHYFFNTTPTLELQISESLIEMKKLMIRIRYVSIGSEALQMCIHRQGIDKKVAIQSFADQIQQQTDQIQQQTDQIQQQTDQIQQLKNSIEVLDALSKLLHSKIEYIQTRNVWKLMIFFDKTLKI